MKNIKKVYSKGNIRLVSLFCMLAIFTGSSSLTFAQDGNIELKFEQQDGDNICTAVLKADNAPVKEAEIHFYVKRTYSLLPIGKPKETDENGEARMTFPNNLPGDQNGNIIVVATVEDDDNLGSVKAEEQIKWGVPPAHVHETWGDRSLSASRENAPMALILVSNAIIAIIWGTILYVILQVFRIRKASKMLKTKSEFKS